MRAQMLLGYFPHSATTYTDVPRGIHCMDMCDDCQLCTTAVRSWGCLSSGSHPDEFHSLQPIDRSVQQRTSLPIQDCCTRHRTARHHECPAASNVTIPQGLNSTVVEWPASIATDNVGVGYMSTSATSAMAFAEGGVCDYNICK